MITFAPQTANTTQITPTLTSSAAHEGALDAPVDSYCSDSSDSDICQQQAFLRSMRSAPRVAVAPAIPAGATPLNQKQVESQLKGLTLPSWGADGSRLQSSEKDAFGVSHDYLYERNGSYFNKAELSPLSPGNYHVKAYESFRRLPNGSMEHIEFKDLSVKHTWRPGENLELQPGDAGTLSILRADRKSGYQFHTEVRDAAATEKSAVDFESQLEAR